MTQIFHRSTNTIARVSIFGAVFFVATLGWVFAKLDRSAYNTGEGVTLAQPVPFSHDHHTVALGIDCRYCHTSVETSAYAGIPPTATCMNCHSLIWKESPMLEQVRQSYASGESIPWTKVNDLPDYVYFNHSIHVTKGFGCATCHGRVDQMPLMRQAESLQMEWCLDCHRQPEKYVRPREAIFDMAWQPESEQHRQELGTELIAKYQVNPSVTCSRCHR